MSPECISYKPEPPSLQRCNTAALPLFTSRSLSGELLNAYGYPALSIVQSFRGLLNPTRLIWQLSLHMGWTAYRLDLASLDVSVPQHMIPHHPIRMEFTHCFPEITPWPCPLLYRPSVQISGNSTPTTHQRHLGYTHLVCLDHE